MLVLLTSQSVLAANIYGLKLLFPFCGRRDQGRGRLDNPSNFIELVNGKLGFWRATVSTAWPTIFPVTMSINGWCNWCCLSNPKIEHFIDSLLILPVPVTGVPRAQTRNHSILHMSLDLFPTWIFSQFLYPRFDQPFTGYWPLSNSTRVLNPGLYPY